MDSAVNALQTNVTTLSLWGNIGTMMPFLGTMILFGFGYYLLRRVVRGIRTGKAKI